MGRCINKVNFLSLWQRAWKVINSKFIVLITVLGILTFGSITIFNNAKADISTNYKFGTAFQYFLLDGKGETLEDKTSTKKYTKFLGAYNNGAQGSFTYGEIIDNGSANGDERTAREFVSMVATYSKFNYFSTQNQGFNIILPIVGRFILGFVALVAGFIYDIYSSVIFGIPTLVAKFNVIPLIAAWFTKQNVFGDGTIAEKLNEVLGVNSDTVQTLTTISFTVFIIMVLFSLTKYLSTGKINDSSRKKVISRLSALVLFPAGLALSAMLLSDAVNIAQGGGMDGKSDNIYQKYIIDDETWAKRMNFAPSGNSRASGGIAGTYATGYVDNSFLPYGTTSAGGRIQDINSTSPYYQSDGKFNFSNSAVALRYMLSDTFTADQYIQYEGTQEAQNLNTYGAYKGYADNWTKKTLDKEGKSPDILNTENAYYASNNGSPNKAGDAPDDWNFSEAVDDYSKDEDGKTVLTASPSKVWRERFIFGTKSSGASLEKYYNKKPPSTEQVLNAVGSGNDNSNSISDQSMYLLLSTKFNSTGGDYYLTGPARGLNISNIFDSNRVVYYSFSIVGIPFISILGAIGTIFISIIFWTVAIMAIFSVGLIEMNVKPIETAMKWLFFGDVEYGVAYLIYSVGVVGTILSFSVITRVMSEVGKFLPDVISSALSMITTNSNSYDGMTGEAAMVMGSVSPVASMLLAYILYFVIRHNVNNARTSLIYLFTLPWEISVGYGRKYERLASRGRPNFSSRRGRSRASKVDDWLRRKVDPNGGQSGSWSDAVGDMKQNAANVGNKFAAGKAGIKSWFGNISSGSFDPDSSNKTMDAQDAKRSQMLNTVADNIMDVSDEDLDSRGEKLQKDALKALEAYNNDPSEENYETAKEKVGAFKDYLEANGASPESLTLAHKALGTLTDDPEFNPDTKQEVEDIRRLASDTDNVVQDADVSGITNGQELKNTARDALADYAIDPNSENLDKAITSVKALRDAMQANGATPEELAPLDDQLNKLQSLEVGDIRSLASDTDNVVQTADIDSVPNGQELKDIARNDLANYAMNPNNENLDKSISSVKALRDAMQANGATPEELVPLDDQISKLQALRDTNPINPQERLGFDGVQNIEDAITEPDVISGIPDGYKLRDNAVNDLHEFDKNPNDKTAKQAISSIKALRDANVENGGSAETISKLNTQIDSLEQARQPVLDIDSKISELDGTSLSDTAKEQLQNELSKLQDQPDSADYQGIKNLVSNAEALVTDPQSKNILGGIKNTVKQAELSSIGSNISNMLADTGIVDKPDIQDLTGSITDYQLHPTDDNLSKLQDKMVGMRDKAYLANNPKIADAVNGQFSKLNDIGLSQQTQKVSLDLTSNLNSDDVRDITNSLNNYSVNPSTETFKQLEKSMTDKINSLDNSGQGDLSKVVRDNLTNLQNINAQHINSNFGNNLRQALGNARNNESIIKLLNKVDLAKTTPEKLNVTKEITASVQKQGLENDIDSKKLAESIRLIQVNQVK
ncbi:hypothetical protein FYL25_09015 [Lactobacillus salivarius]|uniref:Uncharacterized protein n=1 Tax=Ligilactobacillus salivarius TaxID=1624 RepID=A0A6N9IT20_9LACO|nr:hypothetical protein [Ligilactobacillus salivarius]MYY65526.1 hypothetical protein [Ligilactobacillus salivarius]